VTTPGFESSGNWTEVREVGFPGTSFSRCTQLEGCPPNNGDYTYVIGNLASGRLQCASIAVSPNKEYDLSAWVSGLLDDADCNGTGQVRVVYYDGSQVEISSENLYTTTPSQTSTTWQQVGKRILTPTGTATVRIQLRLTQVSGWLDFDDVSLQEVMTYNLYYDGENRMVKVMKGTTPIAAYSYDGDGLRVRQVLTATGATTTAFVKNYYEQSGTTITKYYYAGSQRVAVRTGTDVRYLFGDHLGSTSVSADVSGGSVTRQLYKAWGETRYSSGLPTKYQYTGQYSNTSDFGLMFYNARWYDPYLNRWTSPDSIIPDQYNPQSWDRYAYVRNNPINRVDPSGHVDFSCLMEGCPESLPTVTVVLGGTYGQSNGTDFEGPDPQENLSMWIDRNTITVKFPGNSSPGSGDGKYLQAEAANEQIIWFIDYNIVIIGYSSGADAAPMLGEIYYDTKIGGAGNVTDIAMLGPTFSGDTGHGDLGQEWSGLFDKLSRKGTDILVINDSAWGGDDATNYQPPDGATGFVQTQSHPTWNHATDVRNYSEIKYHVLNWFLEY